MHESNIHYGFFFDPGKCVHCRSCELACMSVHHLPPGRGMRKMLDLWKGEFPEVRRHFFTLSCMHCSRPACVEACPAQAVSKDEANGLVLVDREACIGCGSCLEACPFDVPQFDAGGIMFKCDYCAGQGFRPACTRHCPTDALMSGQVQELSRLVREKSASRLEGETGPYLWITDSSGGDN